MFGSLFFITIRLIRQREARITRPLFRSNSTVFSRLSDCSLRERGIGTPVKVYFYTANVDKINIPAKYFSDFLC